MSTTAMVDSEGTQAAPSDVHTALEPVATVDFFTKQDIDQLAKALSASRLHTAVEPGGGAQRAAATSISTCDLHKYKPAFNNLPEWVSHPPNDRGVLPLAPMPVRLTSFYMEPTLNTAGYTAAMRAGGHVERDYDAQPDAGPHARPADIDNVAKELAELQSVQSDYALADAAQSQYVMDGADAAAEQQADGGGTEAQRRAEHYMRLQIIQAVLERARAYNEQQAAEFAELRDDAAAEAFALRHDSGTDTAVEPQAAGAVLRPPPVLVYVSTPVRVLQRPADASDYIPFL